MLFRSVHQSRYANAEEMASSSEELASQAEQLNDVVSYFKIESEKIIADVPKKNAPHPSKMNSRNNAPKKVYVAHENELECEEFVNF